MQKLRVGLIGAGGMADAHLPGLTSFEDVQIAAFCDVVQERAQAQADKVIANHGAEHGTVAYSDPATMIREAGLDACYILLPPFAHGQAERACVESGVPFLVEKPIGLDLGLLREIRDEVVRKGLTTAAGYMNRYQPSVQAAKAAFANDEPILAHGGWIGGPPTRNPGEQPTSLIGVWWVQKDKSGGQMHEQVTHTVDLVRYFMGDAVEVYAHTTTAFNKKLPNLAPNYTIDDAMTTTIKFANGGIATIYASASTPVGGGITLDILGMKSAVKFNGWGHDVKILTKDGKETKEETVASESKPFPLEDRQFLDAVKTGDKPKILTDYADAFKTAQLTVGANQSAATGKPVDLTA